MIRLGDLGEDRAAGGERADVGRRLGRGGLGGSTHTLPFSHFSATRSTLGQMPGDGIAFCWGKNS